MELQRQQLLAERQQFQRDQLKAAEMRALQSPTLQPQTPLLFPPPKITPSMIPHPTMSQTKGVESITNEGVGKLGPSIPPQSDIKDVSSKDHDDKMETSSDVHNENALQQQPLNEGALPLSKDNSVEDGNHGEGLPGLQIDPVKNAIPTENIEKMDTECVQSNSSEQII